MFKIFMAALAVTLLTGCQIMSAFVKSPPQCEKGAPEAILQVGLDIHAIYNQCAETAPHKAAGDISKRLVDLETTYLIASKAGDVYPQDTRSVTKIFESHMRHCYRKRWNLNILNLYWGEMLTALQIWYANEARIKDCNVNIIRPN